MSILTFEDVTYAMFKGYNMKIDTNTGEVIFGQSISGIKGFYSTVTMATDTTTDYGGPKTLFSVESNYSMNNGY